MGKDYVIIGGQLYGSDKFDRINSLQHYKYIKKVRGKNGKWRYFYKQPANEKQETNGIQNNSPYGTYVTKSGRHTYKVEKSNKLLSEQYTSTIRAMDKGTIKQGKLFMQYVLD